MRPEKMNDKSFPLYVSVGRVFIDDCVKLQVIVFDRFFSQLLRPSVRWF